MGKVVVCGAGSAGLSAAASLRRVGLDAVIVQRSDRVGASWRSRYPALRLNTTGWMSTMPGYRASVRRYGEHPSRDAWIPYLEDYSRHHGLEVRFDTAARRVSRSDGAWSVETNGGS